VFGTLAILKCLKFSWLKFSKGNKIDLKPFDSHYFTTTYIFYTCSYMEFNSKENASNSRI